MSSSNKMSLLIVISLALALSCSAQNSPQDYLNVHNAARAQVGVGPMSWDTSLVSYAQNYANSRNGNCDLVHSGGPYGENLAWGSWSTFSGVDASNMWVNERQDYNYGSNTCAPGKVCGHYTQVVWRSSTRLGCARVPCNNNGGWLVICSYNPPGNYVGQRPY
ncbi:hypothetical protein V2J09_006983 [Rumex salicifolius]